MEDPEAICADERKTGSGRAVPSRSPSNAGTETPEDASEDSDRSFDFLDDIQCPEAPNGGPANPSGAPTAPGLGQHAASCTASCTASSSHHHATATPGSDLSASAPATATSSSSTSSMRQQLAAPQVSSSASSSEAAMASAMHLPVAQSDVVPAATIPQLQSPTATVTSSTHLTEPIEDSMAAQHGDVDAPSGSINSPRISEAISSDSSDEQNALEHSPATSDDLSPVGTTDLYRIGRPEGPKDPIEEDDKHVLEGTAAPRIPLVKRSFHAQYMVLGEYKVGKTSLTDQLVHSLTTNSDAVSTHGTQLMEGHPAGPILMKLTEVKIPRTSGHLHMKIVDMPGWGDDITAHEYLKIVTTYIVEQRKADYEDRQRNTAFTSKEVFGCLRHSVTAVLYLVPPQGLKKSDLVLMSAISQQVPLIPIIAKADTMTEEETQQYRQTILQCLFSPGLWATNYVRRPLPSDSPPLKINFFSFDADDELPSPPFTIITSDQYDSSGNPVRQCACGRSETTDHNRSDFVLLKKLLTGDEARSLQRLLETSWDRYKAFASAFEAGSTDNRLELIIMAACAPFAPYLDHGKYQQPQDEINEDQAQNGQGATAEAVGSAFGRAAQQLRLAIVLSLLLGLIVVMLTLWAAWGWATPNLEPASPASTAATGANATLSIPNITQVPTGELLPEMLVSEWPSTNSSSGQHDGSSAEFAACGTMLDHGDSAVLAAELLVLPVAALKFILSSMLQVLILPASLLGSS